MHNYKELKIWIKAMELARTVYPLVDSFPKSETYSLVQQIRKCLVSIPSNIAEGSAKSSNKDFRRFLEISLGSAFELETQMILAKDFNFLDLAQTDTILETINELQKMIYGFKNKLS